MSTKKICLIYLLVLLLLGSLSAEQKYPRPRSSEVVIVTRVVINPGFNYQFFKQYWPLIAFRRERDRGSHSYKANIKSGTRRTFEIPAVDDGNIFLAGKHGIPRDRTLQLTYFEYLLAGNGRLKVILPVGASFVIPEGTNYVYIGTFEFTINNTTFDVEGIRVLDEFDEAQDFVLRTYGSRARLVRVPLIDQEE